jgi:hypothetical protein
MRIDKPDTYRLANKLHSITTTTTSTEMAEAVGSGISAVMITATEDAFLAFGGEVDTTPWSDLVHGRHKQTHGRNTRLLGKVTKRKTGLLIGALVQDRKYPLYRYLPLEQYTLRR